MMCRLIMTVFHGLHAGATQLEPYFAIRQVSSSLGQLTNRKLINLKRRGESAHQSTIQTWTDQGEFMHVTIHHQSAVIKERFIKIRHKLHITAALQGGLLMQDFSPLQITLLP